MPIFMPKASFTRPADTTQYSFGDLVANSATPASVAPLMFPVPSQRGDRAFKLGTVSMHKTALLATAAVFALALFSDPHQLTIGDNAAFTAPDASHYLGLLSLDMSTGGTTFTAGGLFKQFPVTSNLYVHGKLSAYLVAFGTYVPASAEVFTVQLGLEG